jgi:hypothetical protein
VQLELSFDNYYITPTPFGERTVVPASDAASESYAFQPDSATPTIAIPSFGTSPGEIEFYELMGASLLCSETSFRGCDVAGDVSQARRITLNGITWTWIISPQDTARGVQDLKLELWRVIVINEGSETAEVVWDYAFQIEIVPDSTIPSVDLVMFGFRVVILAVGIAVIVITARHYLTRRKRIKATFFKKTPSVFISYRRDVSAGFAQIIHDKLESLGANVFIDVNDIHAGDFSDYIKQSIRASDFFVLILAPKTLESSWVIQELQYAYEHNKIIIPVLMNDFSLYGSEVPAELQFLQTLNAVELRPQYVDAAVALIAKYIADKSK